MSKFLLTKAIYVEKSGQYDKSSVEKDDRAIWDQETEKLKFPQLIWLTL